MTEHIERAVAGEQSESELTKVKRKIRALTEKTADRGCTEAEAMLAMRKVGELLLQYNLTMDEVTLRQEPCVTKTYTTDSKKRNALWECFGGLQRFAGVKIYITRPSSYTMSLESVEGICWSFFGLEPDVDMCIYLSDLLCKAEKSATAEFKHSDAYQNYEGHKHSVIANFRVGFGQRINTRLHDMAREQAAEEAKAAKYHQEQMAARMVEATDEAKVAAANAITGTALICVSKAKFVNEEFVKRGPKLRTKRSTNSIRRDVASRQAGWDAGSRVNLNRPISSSKKNSGLLE